MSTLTTSTGATYAAITGANASKVDEGIANNP